MGNIDNVIIQNGIEIEVDDKEYINYLKSIKQPVTWSLLERLKEI